MVRDRDVFLSRAQAGLQSGALCLIVALAVTLALSSGLAAVGLLPWLELGAGFGGQAAPQAGMFAQLGATALGLALCFFVPSSLRIMRLERSHRSFHISMADVERAYIGAHSADRQGAFTLSGEYDAMRERINHLRNHPDLMLLEPDLLEVAAPMSLQSRDLARVYSDHNIARAKQTREQGQKGDEEGERDIGSPQ